MGSVAARLEQVTRVEVGAVDLADARDRWREVRADIGGHATAPGLVATDALGGRGNVKLRKSAAAGLSLAPARSAGIGTVCPASTAQCRADCLASSGRGGAPDVRYGREVRTVFAARYPVEFLALVAAEVGRLPAGAAVRLNVLSDVAWERAGGGIVLERADCRGIPVYDYTKRRDRDPTRAYRLAYSVSERERTVDDIGAAVRLYGAAAVVVDLERGEPIPDRWAGFRTVDADLSDRWILDARRPVVGLLRPKGTLRGAPVGWSRFVKPAVA